MTEERARELRFYGIGIVVCLLMLLTAATWLGAQEAPARIVGAMAFVTAAAVGTVVAALRTRAEDSSFRQDPAAPGNRMFWRLAIGAAFIAVFDDALAGVAVFGATGFMIGLVGTILLATRIRASRP